MKTLADLRAIKEKAKKEMAAREENTKYRIVVSMGTCGIAAGARTVMTAILDEINKSDIRNTIVSQTGCLGYCDQEPMLQIYQAGQAVITYGKVNDPAARKIVKSHISKGTVVADSVFMMH